MSVPGQNSFQLSCRLALISFENALMSLMKLFFWPVTRLYFSVVPCKCRSPARTSSCVAATITQDTTKRVDNVNGHISL